MSKTPDTIGEIQIVLAQILEKQDANQKENTKRLDEIIEHLQYTNGKVMRNTEFRLRTEGIISLLKSIGIINVIIAIGLIIDYFVK